MKKPILTVTLAALYFVAGAQLLKESKPIQLEAASTALQAIQPAIMPIPDLARLKKEDELNDKFKDKPWRFGENFAVDLGISNAGTWHTKGNKAIWQLQINSANALTLNYFFDSFFLPSSAELFIIDNKTGEYFGSISTDNNSALNTLGTYPFQGDSHTIQLSVDLDQKKEVKLHLSQVTHAYRGEKDANGLGDSGPCEKNAICAPQQYINQRNSTVIILSNGNGRCTGTLVNNTLNNGRPFILTAEHCGQNVSNWVFRFNYQSTSCDQTTLSGSNHTISGASVKAHHSESDFQLLEMTSKPPLSYNPYYAGWDKSETNPTSQFCFHHPAGDIKKFSVDNNPATKAKYLDDPSGAETWKIGAWDSGVTEGGSSGSALFNQQGRVIGQLFGGESDCSAPDKPDYYGRIGVSFKDRDSTATLLYWLDPGYSGPDILDGFDPNTPKPELDVAVAGINGVSAVICGNSFTPQIKIYNNGTKDLKTLTVKITIDGGASYTKDWSGTLLNNNYDYVTFNQLTVANGTHLLKVELLNPNGGSDESVNNNTANRSFKTNDKGLIHTVRLVLDDYGSENTWKIFDAGNVVLAEGGPYVDFQRGKTINESVCLSPGCYKIEVTDSYGDGMCSSPSSTGCGSYSFIDNFGNTRASGWRTAVGPEDEPVTESTNFCLYGVGIASVLPENISVYPIPASESLNVVGESNQTYQASVMDVTGKLVLQTEISGTARLSTDKLENGMYFLKLARDGKSQTFKIQISK